MLKMILAFFAHIFGFKSDVDDVSGPCFESLEPKTLMSASPFFFSDNNGTLQVFGTDADDKVAIEVVGKEARVSTDKKISVFSDVQGLYVYLAGGKNSVSVSVISPSDFFYTQIITGDQKDFVRFSGVGLSSVEKSGIAFISTNGGDDKVIVDTDQGVYVSAGFGDDFITTAGYNKFFQVNHQFVGGPGDDLLITHTGGILYGEDGNDRLISKSLGNFQTIIESGSGSDFVRTGAGVNYISTGSGNKIIRGGVGQDTVMVFPTAIWNGLTYQIYPLGKLNFHGGDGIDSLFLHPDFKMLGYRTKGVESITMLFDFKG